MQIHVDGWAWLDVSGWSQSDVVKLQDSLVVVPRQYKDDDSPPKPVYLYREEVRDDGVFLGIPRKHPLVERLGTTFTYDVSLGSPIDVKFHGTPRYDQGTAVEHFVKLFHGKPFEGGILRARGGWGKTVWAAQLIAAMKMTAMVVVHGGYLMDQWEERLDQYLPTARVGRVRQGRCDYAGYDVVIVSIDSLASDTRVYPEELDRWSGLIFSDEVHIIGAQTWAPTIPLFNAAYRVGLSATPRRWDGCAKVFDLHIGKVEYASKTKTMDAKIRRCFTNFKIRKRSPLHEDPPDFVVMRQLKKDPERNDFILDELHLAIDAGRRIMLFSEYRDHLEMLKAAVDATRPSSPTAFFWGGQTREEEAAAKLVQVMFLTYRKASAALDIPDADSMFLVTPRSDIEQAYYRVARMKEGKKTPVITDFIDHLVPFLDRKWKARQRFYRSVGALQ